MKHIRMLVVLFIIGLLTACSPPALSEVVPGDLLGTQQPTAEPTATEEPTQVVLPTATTQPTDEPIAASNCLGCHTDQATLQTLAVEEHEAGEALSTGEG